MAGRIANFASSRRGAAIAALSVMAATSTTAWANGELSVSAELSERRVMVGDVVTLQVRSVARVNGEIAVNVPRVDGLTELSRSTSEGTSISWSSASGQQVTREQTLAIELEVTKPGTISIAPITVRVASFRAQAPPISLIVQGTETVDAPAGSTAAGEVAPPDRGEEALFARYRVDKAEAYLGEQVMLDLEIFASPGKNFSLEEVPNPPELDGFWKEMLFKADRLKRTVQTVGGRRYHVYRLWRAGLFGLSAGERTLPAVRLTFSESRGMFSQGKRIRVRTKPVRVQIKPLPTEGRPAGFKSTNVGQYKLTSRVDAQRVPAGKAVLLTVTLSGQGNIANAKLPEITAIDGFRVFPATVQAAPQAQVGGMSGSKSAEILLMPTRGGRLQIPSVTLPVFNPKTGSYQTLSTPSIRVVVDGEPTAPAAPAPPQATPTDASSTKLRPLRFRSDLTPPTAPPFSQWTYLVALAAPGLVFLLLLWGERVWARARRQTPASRRRAAVRGAKARLAQARARAEAADMAGAYAEFVEALHELGSERLQVKLQGMTTEQILEALADAQASEALIQGVREALQTADYARFAPGAVQGEDPEAALTRFEDILTGVQALRGDGEGPK